jgi:hypothetical protein
MLRLPDKPSAKMKFPTGTHGRIGVTAAVVIAVSLLTGCESNAQKLDRTAKKYPSIYEQAYSDCGTTSREELGLKYGAADGSWDSVFQAMADQAEKYEGDPDAGYAAIGGCGDGAAGRPRRD